MAKISSYPSASPVELTDKLIGTETTNNNATKNFTVGDILTLFNSPTSLTGFVPYTGATSDVNLGVYDLYADEIFGDEVGAGSRFSFGTNTDISLDGDEGNIGDIMLSQGVGNTPIWLTQALFFANAILILPTYPDNTAALAGGLVQGQLYKSATGVVSIVL